MIYMHVRQSRPAGLIRAIARGEHDLGLNFIATVYEARPRRSRNGR